MYIALAPLSLNYAGKLQEKRFDFIKALANIISENLVEVSKIKYFKPNQQTLGNNCGKGNQYAVQRIPAHIKIIAGNQQPYIPYPGR